MPRRNDIAKILVIGSGPIVIGQSAEFDYSGTQACKALKAEGYEVVLVNSNPASIMTDPEVADRTYIEPLTAAYVEEIIRVESGDARPDGLGGKFASAADGGWADGAESCGGSGGLGCAGEVGVELIGAKLEAIKKAEDRLLFKDAMNKIGLDMPRSALVNNSERWVGVCGEDWVSGGDPAFVYAGWFGRRHCLQPRGDDGDSCRAGSIFRRWMSV